MHLYFLLSKGRYGSLPHNANQKKQKDYGINTSPTLEAIFYSVSFWFFICLRWRDAYKKTLLCKSSSVSLVTGVWQFVPSAFRLVPCLHYHLGYLVSTSVAVQFITAIVSVGFSLLASQVGIFIAMLRVVVSLAHYLFRYCKKNSPAFPQGYFYF